ncbi:RidA family protein [Pseudoxanthomonas sp.]|uniref:RidA family protein n=1 Tax=Pseudoxanthomonas sp. TaxID=1871049 RepID=UPI002586C87C|nr:RidA family protein [Pseudoxanthomonas sp.]MCR6685287.1 RidA family protein [Pseudoxanthomonas sp.]
MRPLDLFLALATVVSVQPSHAAEAAPDIVRHELGSWESDIGYSGVVRSGDTLHVSGVACGGEDMEAAVAACYRELGAILQRFGASADQVVKETVYTTDMDALVRAIPARKTFFPDARYPASTWVEVRRLFGAEHRLEVEWTVQLR